MRLIVPYLCFKNKLVFWSLWIRVFLFPLNFVLMRAAIWFHCSLKNGVKLSGESVRHVQLLFLWDGRVASDTLNVVSWQLHKISWQHVVVSRFYIIYCQSKTVHPVFGFHFRGSLFCVDFVGLYWTFLVVRHSKNFRCNGSYIPWIVSWTSFGFSFSEFEVLLPCGSFDKVLSLPLNTFLCAPCSLVTRNGLCC